MSNESNEEQLNGVIATQDHEIEQEAAQKVQKAKHELDRISRKKEAADREIQGRGEELASAFSLFCGIVQAQAEAMDHFTAEDLQYRLQGFLEVYGLVNAALNTSYDKEAQKVGVRFTYTPHGDSSPLIKRDYNFDLNI